MGEPPLTVYSGINDAVLSCVPHSASRVLDIGCGTGTFGAALRSQRERQVVGITYSREEAVLASQRLTEVYCADLNEYDLTPLGKFDCIVMSHVLEHLYHPGRFLTRLRDNLDTDSVIVVALPNVVMWRQRLQFLLGRWRYQDSGILDRTHYRFFDLPSSAALLTDSGYVILKRKCDGGFPLMKPFRPWLRTFSHQIDQAMSEMAPGLLAMQFIYVAKLPA